MEENIRLSLFYTNKSLGDLRENVDTRFISRAQAAVALSRHLILITTDLVRNDLVRIVRFFNKHGRRELFIEGYVRLKARPFLFHNNREKIVKIVNSLADESSIFCYLSRVKALIFGDPGYILISDYAQYWHPIVCAQSGDIVLDGGIGPDANTPKGFAKAVGPEGHVFAFEPIKDNVASLKDDIGGNSSITLIEKGLWESDTSLTLTIDGPVSTIVSRKKNHDKNIQICSMTSVDNFCKITNIRADMIKLDIEGSEQMAINGAKDTILQNHPKLQICLYHSDSDFLDIPLIIKALDPSYKLFVGHHTPYGNECILYAI